MISRFYVWLKTFAFGKDAIRLGRRDIFPFLWPEYLSERQLNHHVHIVGASGYGKSVLLSHLIRESIKRGRGLLFVDLKADISTINQVKRFASEAGRAKDLKIFSLSNSEISSHYNLVASGSPTQLRDRIMTALNWSEEYYRSVAASFLLKSLIGLCYIRDFKLEEFSLKDVWECTLSTERLILVKEKIDSSNTQTIRIVNQAIDFVRERGGVEALVGLRSQLESLLLADFGSLLLSAESEEERARSIDLFQAVKEQQIIYVLLDSRRYSESAKSVARFVLQDLKATSARIDAEVPAGERSPFTCVIDEFSDMATEDFVSFLDRARSSKMSVVVAHQELADLKKVSDTFAARLTGNCSTMYAFLQKNAESAEQICAMAGTRKVDKETRQYEGFGLLKWPTGGRSVRETEEFRVHPNVVKSLRVGEAVVIKKYPVAQAYRVRIHAPPVS